MSDSKKSWKSYLPHLRVLPEENQDLYLEDTTSSIVAEEELHHDLGKSSKVDVTAESTAVEAHPQNLRHELPYEVRDEAGRKWWKYFDEFEYRVNKEYKKSRKWYEFLYPNHTTQTKAERRLLYKLDIVIALYFFMLCWSKSVDSNNYTNAYVSNMKEDLK